MLTAIVARQPSSAILLDALPGARVAPLAGGIVLVPLAADVLSAVCGGGVRWVSVMSDEGLPPALERVLAGVSELRPLAYVESEVWGGSEESAAVVWEHRRVVLGPLLYEDSGPWKYRGPRQPGEFSEKPINRALRRLGVRRAPHELDEFATVKLGRHRTTDDWHRSAAAGRGGASPGPLN